MKGVILETLPPVRRGSTLAPSTFKSEPRQSSPRDHERMFSQDWEYSLEKNWHNLDSVHRRHRSATAKHKTDPEDKNKNVFMENMDIFPMKPVCHKRAFNLNNCQASNDHFTRKDPERLDCSLQRKPTYNRPPERYQSRSEHSEPSRKGDATKGSQTKYEDLYRLPKNEIRMMKEIRMKEIILQEKLLRAEEGLRKVQLRAESGHKGRRDERNRVMEKAENRLYYTEKGNWDWESIRGEHTKEGRRNEGRRERLGDWERGNRTYTDRWEMEMDKGYRERRKEGTDWENMRRNTVCIGKKEWDLKEDMMKPKRERDRTNRDRAIEWDWRDWQEKESVNDDKRRGEGAIPKKDMGHQEEQWNIMGTFKANSHVKLKANPKHNWRLTQERLQQQSRRTAEQNTGGIRKVLSNETAPQSPPLNQRSSQPQQVEPIPEKGPDAGVQLVPCRVCNRCFARDRLERHSRVCEKQLQFKRKAFDSAQYRAKGTDLEVFMRTNIQRKTPELKKNNWRQKHEALIHNLRQARAPASGGSQPWSSADVNPDYVSCPHCGRRFAPGPAERHIPKCQNIKSKPPPPPRHRH